MKRSDNLSFLTNQPLLWMSCKRDAKSLSEHYTLSRPSVHLETLKFNTGFFYLPLMFLCLSSFIRIGWCCCFSSFSFLEDAISQPDHSVLTTKKQEDQGIAPIGGAATLVEHTFKNLDLFFSLYLFTYSFIHYVYALY